MNKAVLLENYKVPNFYITNTKLDFEILKDKIVVKSNLHIKKNTNSTENTLILNGEDLVTKNVSINNISLEVDEYYIENNFLSIPTTLEEFTLQTEVEINPYKNTTLMGIYFSKGCIASQCEPEGFRRITWFIDRPDVMSLWQVSITDKTKSYSTLLSNGNVIKEEVVDTFKKVTFEDICPKPSYLFALVAGNFDSITDTFTTKSGRNVQLNVFVEKGKKDQSYFAMESLKKSMKWDEDTYGLEYELDIFSIVAVADFNFGAMENKSLNIFNEAYVLANPEIATDDDYFNIESIVAHEYFHNFTGNRITCRDWFQLTLKEGLTVFRDHKFSEDLHDQGVVRVGQVNILRNHQFQEDASALSHPIRPNKYIEINNFYTSTVYEKGSEVIRMIHTLIGAENFRKGIDKYFEKHDGQAVTCEDFISSMEEASGFNLQKFNKWYTQSGTPNVYVEDTYNKEDKSLKITITQKTYPTADQKEKQSLVIPFSIALIQSGKLTDSQIITLEENKHEVIINNVKEKPTLSLNRSFSAPVIVHYSYNNSQLLEIIKNETDGFNKFEAMQKLIKSYVINNVEGKNMSIDSIFDAINSILSNYKNHAHLSSYMLRLPPIVSFEDHYKKDFPLDEIYHILKDLKKDIANKYNKQMCSIFKSLEDDNNVFSAEMMGIRSLKNTLLSYMALDSKNLYKKEVLNYYKEKSMTKKLGALSATYDNNLHDYSLLKSDFIKNYKNHSTAVNKWLALYASMTQGDVLDRIKILMTRSHFNIKNPNNVRAVLGSFVANVIHFHNEDGSGYNFLADQIIILDKINPSISSALAKAFSKVKSQNSIRKEKAKEALDKILSSGDISKGLREILEKINDIGDSNEKN